MILGKVRRIGVHISIAGGIPQAVLRAKALGCNTLQIFSHNPRSWERPSISEKFLTEFKRLRHLYDINPLYIHLCYLVNIASINKKIRQLSLKMLQWELETADLLGADYLVIHPGSCSRDPEAGIIHAMESLKQIAISGRWNVKILLENTAGERGDIASTVEELAKLYLSSGEIVGGICIDTCHAFQAGYDLRNENGIERFTNSIEKKIGLDKVKLIHLNDSRRDLSSGIDRHDHIGKGKIGTEGLKRFLAHPTFREVPIILETPKKTDLDDRKNLRALRKIWLRFRLPGIVLVDILFRACQVCFENNPSPLSV